MSRLLFTIISNELLKQLQQFPSTLGSILDVRNASRWILTTHIRRSSDVSYVMHARMRNQKDIVFSLKRNAKRYIDILIVSSHF